MPNAIAPTDAQINIAKFNKSSIAPALIDYPWVYTPCLDAQAIRRDFPAQPQSASAIVAEEPAR
jgi:hypothetical protein